MYKKLKKMIQYKLIKEKMMKGAYTMEYILMNKNKPLCKISIDSEQHFIIENILDVYAPKEAFPIGVDIVAGRPQRKSLAKWWAGRAIPGSRIGGSSFEQRYQVKLAALPFKNHGLSLSDQYWIKLSGSDIKWKDINFFDNDFSLEMGKALFDSSYVSTDLNYMSPDNTSDGMLPKKWLKDVSNRKTYLLKAGSGPFEQEPFNERIASKILNLLDVDEYIQHVDYRIINENGRYVCSCENFITPNTEFVTANNIRITKSLMDFNWQNQYDFFLKCCEPFFDVDKAKKAFDIMLAVDYIMCNYDRHYGNFGFIRDVENYKVISVAPIFDTGSSLWNKSTLYNIGKTFEAKAFCPTHDENAELITNYDLLDLGRLRDIDDLVKSVLQDNINLPVNRIDAIAKAVKMQVDKLQKIKDCEKLLY